MTGTKPFWRSRTVVASLVGLLALILHLLGVELEQREALTDAVYQVVEGVAFLVALWGRLDAGKRLV